MRSYFLAYKAKNLKAKSHNQGGLLVIRKSLDITYYYH